MQMVNIISIAQELQIFWVKPDNGGDTITEYQLELYIPSTQSYILDKTECDGSTLATLTTTQKCYRHDYLIQTYAFQIGQLVQARVRAYNVNGFSDWSQLNVNGASIQSEPSQMLALSEGSTTTVNQI